MSSSFSCVNVVDMSKEKDWPANLGMLDWDSTNIVFTKRSLIEFLKYTGTTVDPNFTNISKLPRYAKFGKIISNVGETAVPTIPALPAIDGPADDFKPTRRVRTVPGGPHSDIFATDNEGDALSMAPPKDGTSVTIDSASDVVAELPTEPAGFKPTRRVRTTPGGPSSIGSLWDEPEPAEFKPTRRVREGPGGQDNINGIF